jgi:hypothetical protein
MVKTFAIGEIFTDRELKKAKRLWLQSRNQIGVFHNRCVAEIVTPALSRINTTTEQQNDPRYLAYLLEAALMRTE